MAGRSLTLELRGMYTKAFGTPTWLALSASVLPGVTTRPERSVGLALAQLGTASQSVQPATPPRHVVGPPPSPLHVSKAAQVRPSAAQSKICPQLFTAFPHCQPRAAQLEPLGTQGGCVGAPHWKGASTPQASPTGQPPVPRTAAQSKRCSAVVPQPSKTTPHSLPAQALAALRG
jgi:hypothetical protein